MSKNGEQSIRKIDSHKIIRLFEPRIPCLHKKEAREMRKLFNDKSEWDKLVEITINSAKQRKNFMIQNLMATLMRNRELSMRLWTFMNYIWNQSSLPERDREILTLRISWLCRSEYLWANHVVSGKRAGLSYDDINRIIEKSDTEGWSPFDATLLRAVDELYTDAFISEITWKVLAEHYNTYQLMDLVFIIGTYAMLAMGINTFGIQLEKGKIGFPE